MANLVLTTECQRNCSYCFATKEKVNLEWNNFITILKFLEESDYRFLNFIGGEPTLHLRYKDYLKHALAKGFIINTFTNGMLSSDLISYFKTLVKVRKWLDFGLVVNINDNRSKEEDRLVRRTLKELNNISSLGYNIHSPDCDLNFLIDLILEYRLQNTIRIGLAHPNKEKTNKFLATEDYMKVKDKIMNITSKRRIHEINMVFDCGFPMCMFSKEDVGDLFLSPMAELSFRCSPAVDIFPDLTVSSCYPFVDERLNILDFENYKDLVFHLSETLNNRTCIRDECGNCWYLGRICGGGCRAHRINKPLV